VTEPAIPSPAANAHFQAVGRLCLAWAVLNRKVTDLASVLIGAGPETTACIFPGSENMKPRYESIKKLAVLLMPGRDVEWRDRLIELVKEIQEPLANARNRYVHDEWSELPGAISRVEWNASIDRSDRRTGPRIRTTKWHIDTTEDIDRLIGRIKEVTSLVSLAVIAASEWRPGGLPPTPFWG
jgi:hypothetical protein